MSKPSALTFCCCLAALPLIGCANGAGPQSQAYMPGPGYAPTAAYSPAPAYAPVAPIAAQPADSSVARVYAMSPNTPAAIVVMLPGPGEMVTSSPQLWADQGFDVVTPTPAEFYQYAAHQQAAAHLIAQAQALADAPIWLVGPNPAIEAAMASMPSGGPGQVSGVVVTSTSTGAGTCREQMVYSYSGNGAAPRVSVSKSGDACPAGSLFGSSSMGPGANSIETPPAPAVRPNAPRLIETSAPPMQPRAPRVIEAAVPAQSGSPAQRAAVQQIANLIKSAPPG